MPLHIFSVTLYVSSVHWTCLGIGWTYFWKKIHIFSDISSANTGNFLFSSSFLMFRGNNLLLLLHLFPLGNFLNVTYLISSASAEVHNCCCQPDRYTEKIIWLAFEIIYMLILYIHMQVGYFSSKGQICFVNLVPTSASEKYFNFVLNTLS